MGEIWTAVPGYEKFYEVSNLGRVRRIAPGPHTRPGFVLKPRLRRRYLAVGLRCGMGGQPTWFSVHRLVCSGFLGAIAPGMHVNHKNGDKTDNHLQNLEVVTPSENCLHSAHVLGNKGVPPRLTGERNHKAKLRETDIPKIFRLREQGLSQQKIADAFGVDQTTISKVLQGGIWKHLR